MKRLFINFGKLDRMFPNKLIELINKCVPGRVKVGKIDLLPRFAFFEVDEHEASEVIHSMSSYEVDGRRIVVDYADKVGEGGGKRARRGAPSKRRDYEKPAGRRDGDYRKRGGGEGRRLHRHAEGPRSKKKRW